MHEGMKYYPAYEESCSRFSNHRSTENRNMTTEEKPKLTLGYIDEQREQVKYVASATAISTPQPCDLKFGVIKWYKRSCSSQANMLLLEAISC